MRVDYPFYARSARVVAVDLLGKRLLRKINGLPPRRGGSRYLSGIIVETEAYCDADVPDLACHADRANKGRPTARTAVMFGQAGISYVYFTYGIHWMFNIVTGEAGTANAVLIRALQPVAGIEWMIQHRGKRPFAQLTNGPAKLAQAFAIDKSLNGANLCDPSGVIWIESAAPIDSKSVRSGARIGMGKTPEPWYSMPWRYWIDGNAFVSK